MTHGQFVSRNLLRNRRRTLLTTASMALFFFLLVLMSATHRYLSAQDPSYDRIAQVLIVTSRVSPSMIPLPRSYERQIATVPGVDGVSPFVTFDAHYGSDPGFLVAFPSHPEVIFKIFNTWQVPEDQRRAYMSEKVALIAGRKTAERFGWKLGDRVPLSSPGHGVTMDLVLRAIYTNPDDESILSFHWDYFQDMRRAEDQGAVFWVVTKSPQDVPRVIQAIDTMFRNGPIETQTQTMKQFMLDFLGKLGNVKLILMSVSAAMLFAMMLIMANTMAMSIRERTTELAVLRALGFRTAQLLKMLTVESLAISLSGTAAGCLAGWGICLLVRNYRIGGWVQAAIRLDAVTLGLALAAAVGIALLSTLLPAYRATRTGIADALRSVG